MVFPAFSCMVFLRGVKPGFAERAFRIPVRRGGNRFPQRFHSSRDEVALVRKTQLSHVTQKILVGIARLARKKQTRVQSTAADARCCPLTLLLCFIEAIEVAFRRHAPWIFLSVSGLRGQTTRNNHTQYDSRKGESHAIRLPVRSCRSDLAFLD